MSYEQVYQTIGTRQQQMQRQQRQLKQRERLVRHRLSEQQHMTPSLVKPVARRSGRGYLVSELRGLHTGLGEVEQAKKGLFEQQQTIQKYEGEGYKIKETDAGFEFSKKGKITRTSKIVKETEQHFKDRVSRGSTEKTLGISEAAYDEFMWSAASGKKDVTVGNWRVIRDGDSLRYYKKETKIVRSTVSVKNPEYTGIEKAISREKTLRRKLEEDGLDAREIWDHLQSVQIQKGLEKKLSKTNKHVKKTYSTPNIRWVQPTVKQEAFVGPIQKQPTLPNLKSQLDPGSKYVWEHGLTSTQQKQLERGYMFTRKFPITPGRHGFVSTQTLFNKQLSSTLETGLSQMQSSKKLTYLQTYGKWDEDGVTKTWDQLKHKGYDISYNAGDVKLVPEFDYFKDDIFLAGKKVSPSDIKTYEGGVEYIQGLPSQKRHELAEQWISTHASKIPKHTGTKWNVALGNPAELSRWAVNRILGKDIPTKGEKIQYALRQLTMSTEQIKLHDYMMIKPTERFRLTTTDAAIKTLVSPYGIVREVAKLDDGGTVLPDIQKTFYEHSPVPSMIQGVVGGHISQVVSRFDDKPGEYNYSDVVKKYPMETTAASFGELAAFRMMNMGFGKSVGYLKKGMGKTKLLVHRVSPKTYYKLQRFRDTGFQMKQMREMVSGRYGMVPSRLQKVTGPFDRFVYRMNIGFRKHCIEYPYNVGAVKHYIYKGKPSPIQHPSNIYLDRGSISSLEQLKNRGMSFRTSMLDEFKPGPQSLNNISSWGVSKGKHLSFKGEPSISYIHMRPMFRSRGATYSMGMLDEFKPGPQSLTGRTLVWDISKGKHLSFKGEPSVSHIEMRPTFQYTDLVRSPRTLTIKPKSFTPGYKGLTSRYVPKVYSIWKDGTLQGKIHYPSWIDHVTGCSYGPEQLSKTSSIQAGYIHGKYTPIVKYKTPNIKNITKVTDKYISKAGGEPSYQTILSIAKVKPVAKSIWVAQRPYIKPTWQGIYDTPIQAVIPKTPFATTSLSGLSQLGLLGSKTMSNEISIQGNKLLGKLKQSLLPLSISRQLSGSLSSLKTRSAFDTKLSQVPVSVSLLGQSQIQPSISIQSQLQGQLQGLVSLQAFKTKIKSPGPKTKYGHGYDYDYNHNSPPVKIRLPKIILPILPSFMGEPQKKKKTRPKKSQIYKFRGFKVYDPFKKGGVFKL